MIGQGKMWQKKEKLFGDSDSAITCDDSEIATFPRGLS